MEDNTHSDIMVYQAQSGETISTIASKALNLSRGHHRPVSFEFNNVAIVVNEKQRLDEVMNLFVERSVRLNQRQKDMKR